jgi:small-conductance mechanosensitive channel
MLALAIAGLWWVRRGLDRLLARRVQGRIHAVGIQSFEVMRAEQIWTAVRRGVVALQTLIIVGGALLWAGFVFAQFPWTRGRSRDMFALALAPLREIGGGLLDHAPSLAFLAVLFLLARLTLRVIRLFFDAVARGRVVLTDFDPDWAAPTYKIARVAVVAFALVIAYPYIPGAESPAFKGVSLFIGVLFSLGSSGAIANIVAGYMMTYRRAFKTGDRIRIGTAVGDVVETRLQVTHLRTVKNEEIVVPNSQILAGEVVNYSSLARERGLILHTLVGIGYATPWRQVEAMLLQAAARTPGVAREPGPFVLERELGAFAVTYELNVYCTDVQEMERHYAALHRNVLDVFNEYGVQIMTPAYERDPPAPQIVPRADWFTPPAAAPAERRPA